MSAKNLLIVESPAKAGTIKKYLGANYNVIASMGHVIDLPKSQLAVSLDDGTFEPKYITIRGKGDLLSQLKREAKKADKVFLATDPDREGEAISWHLANALNIDANSKCRVTFNEITKSAVKNAIKEPRAIDKDLVDAQQARRVLDRIVGYKISPILWEKVKRGLSAGRVQSVATRLICDREDEIENFVPEEYWSIDAIMTDENSKHPFEAKYYGENNKEKKLSDSEETSKVVSELKKSSPVVADIKSGVKNRRPQPPFTTSTLQQDASRKINFQAAKTMQIAQMLYEGINLGGKIGTIGLITYMRTDSLRISTEAQSEAIQYISTNYGKEYVEPKQFKAKRAAQDAHEAIRPTSVAITPASIKDKLTSDQYKLYKLIWERFVASQMQSAVYETTVATINADKHTLKATGSTLVFKGYMAVYVEGSDEKEKKDRKLPKLEVGQKLLFNKIEPKQHFTQPPARYSEATLVKELEENGIGRPSTYAPTISTIVSRGYVTRRQKQLIPTELGKVTTEIMKNNFKDIVDVDFTADMEAKLDDVESGNVNWVSVLSGFYPKFKTDLENAITNVAKIQIKDEESDVVCEKCGRKMVYKLSKFGKFLACPGYPECKNAKAIRTGTGVKCPKCDGEILIKKSRKGKTYYGCENSPKCDFLAWYAPVKGEACPECGSILLQKPGKSGKIICYNENCTYERKSGNK